MATYDVPRRPHPTARLPLPYHWLPAAARFRASRWLLGGDDPSRVPAERAFASDRGPWPAPWPHGKAAALAISHDVDTVHGLVALPRTLELEAALGVRSTVFVTGDVLSRHHARLACWRARGVEVGLHGWRHDQRLPHLAGRALERRIRDIAAICSDLDIGGFRAPSLWVREESLLALAPVVRYDSSVPSYRAASRLAPERGAFTCRPFRVGELWELPVSLPLDDDLLRAGLAGAALVEALVRVVDAVVERRGLAVHLDHTEPHLSGNTAGRARHEAFLTRVLARDDLWVAPLADVRRALGPG